MAGLTPAPPPPPFVASDADPRLVVPLGTESDPTLLVPGVGTFVRADPDAGRVLLDSATSEPALGLSHFHSGPLPAAGSEVRRWDLNRLVNSGVGAFFEVTLGTPQTDVAAGHYGLRVAGSVSGSTDLELNVEGQDRYTLDLQAPDLLGDSASSSGWSPNDQYRGWGCVFQVSSPVTVHGLSAEGTVSGAAASPASRRFGILDTSGRWLTYGESEEGMAAGRVIPMRYALDLEPGVNYIASVLAEAGAIAGYGDRDGAYSGAVVSASWQPPELARIGEGGSYAKGLGITHDNADPDATFRDVVERSTGYGYDARSDFDAEGFMFIQTNAWPFGLHGRTSGLLLEGDVIVTTTVTGAPTVTPADVNLRLEVAQAGGA